MTASPDFTTDSLAEGLYEQLRRIAHARFEKLPPSATLQPTDVLHETYLKLARRPWRDEHHFVATFAIAVQQVLIDIARARTTRRGPTAQRPRIDLDAVPWHDPVHHPDAVLLLDEAVAHLRLESEVAADTILMHLLLDLDTGTIAGIQGTSTRTVQRRLAAARTWVYEYMTKALAHD